MRRRHEPWRVLAEWSEDVIAVAQNPCLGAAEIVDISHMGQDHPVFQAALQELKRRRSFLFTGCTCATVMEVRPK